MAEKFRGNKLAVCFAGVVLVCMIFPAGCDDEKKKAIAEATAVKMELAKVKTDLAKAQAERDGMKEALAAVQDDLAQTQAELATTKQNCEGMHAQANELSVQRQAAQAMAQSADEIITKLTARLKDAAVKIGELQDQLVQQQTRIAELQTQVAELNKKLLEGQK